ncbi:MAG: hypothetical protein IT269_10445 [Saprospiraceae bacterium]|nr:hypothetical protein [Saprospiraceae bacterium]
MKNWSFCNNTAAIFGFCLLWICLCAAQCEQRKSATEPATATQAQPANQQPQPVPPQSEAPPPGHVDREVKQGAAPNQQEIDADKAKTDKKLPKNGG